jgi:RNA recognition motif-containing protein
MSNPQPKSTAAAPGSLSPLMPPVIGGAPLVPQANLYAGNKRKEPTATQGDSKRRAPGAQRYTAYLGRVPPNVNENVIRYIFSQCGNIVDIRWQQDKISGAFKGNGWVEFDSEAALNKALAQDGVVVEGQAITVAKAVVREPQYEANPTIHIKNLPAEMTEPDIRSLFSHIGVPKAVRMGKDSSGGFGGRAWVEFDDAQTATLALSLNLANVRGHIIEISFAKPKTGNEGRVNKQTNPNLIAMNPGLMFNNYPALANYGAPPGYIVDYGNYFANPQAAFQPAAFQTPNFNGFTQG